LRRLINVNEKWKMFDGKWMMRKGKAQRAKSKGEMGDEKLFNNCLNIKQKFFQVNLSFIHNIL